MSRGKNSIQSPFGGIVYLAGKEQTNVRLTFRGFWSHPTYDCENPDVYERTKNSGAPWGEIVSKSVIFVVPSHTLREIAVKPACLSTFEELVHELVTFLSSSVVRPHRIVFDEDVDPGHSIPGYPIFLSLTDLDGVFAAAQPTAGLMHALTMIGIGSIREGYFDDPTERALAEVAAFASYTNLRGSVGNIEPGSPLARVLWTIHRQLNEKIISTVIQKSQEWDLNAEESLEDRWLRFVRELSDTARFNFAPMIKPIRPISLNVCSHLERYRTPPQSIQDSG
jgi:hypothetical protein